VTRASCGRSSLSPYTTLFRSGAVAGLWAWPSGVHPGAGDRRAVGTDGGWRDAGNRYGALCSGSLPRLKFPLQPPMQSPVTVDSGDPPFATPAPSSVAGLRLAGPGPDIPDTHGECAVDRGWRSVRVSLEPAGRGLRRGDVRAPGG